MQGGSMAKFCVFPELESPIFTPIYLNVYDLTPINHYLYWAGVGAFHSGLQVHGTEYAFGAHDHPTSGVFEVEPGQYPGFTFRKSIFMGTTSLSRGQVKEFMRCQSTNYRGDAYHLVMKNCNHFSEEMCHKLTRNRIPKWVNRLARIASLCNSMLPPSLKKSTKARREKKSLMRFVSSSSWQWQQKERPSCASLGAEKTQTQIFQESVRRRISFSNLLPTEEVLTIRSCFSGPLW